MRQLSLEILGLTFLIPLVFLLRFFELIEADAASGIAGAMVGFFFRTGRQSGETPRE
jgi:hypothetical protein